MEGRSIRVFLATFLVATVALSGAWLAVDGIVHLDEILAAGGPGVGAGRAALRHFEGVAGVHGGTLLGSIGLGSALVAVARARRPRPLGRVD